MVDVAQTGRGTLLALCGRHARRPGGLEPRLGTLEQELLSAYAVDPLPEDAVGAVAAAWSHPTRRARRPWGRMSVASAAMGVLFFGLFLALMALASGVR